MLKIPNRHLQWLQNIQKPLVGIFWHLVWPTIEEDRLPGSSPSNLLSLDHQNAPLLAQPSPHVFLCIKTQHWVQPYNQYKLSNGYALALNHLRLRAHSPPHDHVQYIKKGQSLKWLEKVHPWSHCIPIQSDSSYEKAIR
jgi:hypothetical protein